MPKRIEFTSAADADLVALYLEGVRLFGASQADRYADELQAAIDHLAAFPKSARLEERLRPPMRVHRFRSHVIIYVETGHVIQIVRLRHGRENWLAPDEEMP